MEPEDVVHVLRNMIDAVEPGGLVLDLQVIRPDPVVEAGEERICEIWGEPLLAKADAARAAVDLAVAAGALVDEAADDHDVRKHYPSGADLIDDFADKKRRIPDDAVPGLLARTDPVTMRERCRLRRLRVL
ncbi:MAG TPA: hypothetical protein VFM96_00515 [Gaiellaceae bacterium]|nr:hypothetical protein [Gaiellaceae bacterium]